MGQFITKYRKDFIEIWEDRKNFHVMKGGTEYTPGDEIIFEEYDEIKDYFTGRQICAEVTEVGRNKKGNQVINFKVTS